MSLPRPVLSVALALLALCSLPLPLAGQSSTSDLSASAISYVAPDSFAAGSTRGIVPPPPVINDGSRPFSRVAVGADFSPLGVGVSLTSNINSHFNLRGNGSYLSYSPSTFSEQGVNVNAKLDLASARASLDVYPFRFGWRVSPGVMFHNDNKGTLGLEVAPGQSFTLNKQTYYSGSGANAVTGSGNFGFGNGSSAFTLTTGWGNALPRSGRHLSFPFEIGVAFTQTPTLNFNLTGGEGCNANGTVCVPVATDPQIQHNVAVEVAKYRSDIEPLKTYPIASFGVAYTFGLHRGYSVAQ